MMRVEVLCLLNLAVIGLLPRVFFRPGRLNVHWWLTAAPFLLAAGTLGAALAGVLQPWPVVAVASGAGVPASWSGWFAVLGLGAYAAGCAVAFSIGLIGYTVGTHQRPVSLWHQEEDMPGALVTGGAYARVRHPFYSAFLVALAAVVAAVPHPLSMVAFCLGMLQLGRTAAREERRLLGSPLGAAYREYMGRTGRFLPRRASAQSPRAHVVRERAA